MAGMQGRAVLAGLAVALTLAAGPARAEVVDASAEGFAVRTQVQVAAPPSAVYDALVGKVGAWWDPQHSWSGNAANLSIDARPGGCFCEKLPGGPSDGVQHLTVVFAARGKTLRLAGGLGPLQSMAVSGVMTWTLTEAAGGTVLDMTYAVAGHAKGGLAALAAPVDAVTGTQVRRLKQFVETGKVQ